MRKAKLPSSYSTKDPYVYSPAYQRWAAATFASDEERMRADRAFRKQFHVPVCFIKGVPQYVV